MKPTPPIHVYEVRRRKDKRGVDLISDVLPFSRLCMGEPNGINNAVGYAILVTRRGFVSSLFCVLLGHVFALPRRAVKARAFPVVNTCLSVNPHSAMASSHRRRVGRFLGHAPRRRWAYSRTRLLLSLRFLGSGLCFGRSFWRLGG